MENAESPSHELVPLVHSPAVVETGANDLPALVGQLGDAARFAWDEFFKASLRNPHTRVAYDRAVRRFLAWCAEHDLELPRVTPGHLGDYFAQHSGTIPTKKQHLAAVRGLFDALVLRHVVVLNPAASIKLERYQVIEGKTPEITVEQARLLLASLKLSRTVKNPQGEPVTVPLVVGLRDRVAIGIMVYTAARVGAVAKLRLKDFAHDGSQWTLRFDEKGGKSREIPVRHDLERFILEYLDVAGIRNDPPDSPLLRTALKKTKKLTGRPMTGVYLGWMLKRRLKDAGLPARISPHSFRVATITDLLTQGIPLEEVQYLAGHADPRTTRLYDRRQKKVTRNIVERISI